MLGAPPLLGLYGLCLPSALCFWSRFYLKAGIAIKNVSIDVFNYGGIFGNGRIGAVTLAFARPLVVR